MLGRCSITKLITLILSIYIKSSSWLEHRLIELSSEWWQSLFLQYYYWIHTICIACRPERLILGSFTSWRIFVSGRCYQIQLSFSWTSLRPRILNICQSTDLISLCLHSINSLMYHATTYFCLSFSWYRDMSTISNSLESLSAHLYMDLFFTQYFAGPHPSTIGPLKYLNMENRTLLSNNNPDNIPPCCELTLSEGRQKVEPQCKDWQAQLI